MFKEVVMSEGTSENLKDGPTTRRTNPLKKALGQIGTRVGLAALLLGGIGLASKQDSVHATSTSNQTTEKPNNLEIQKTSTFEPIETSVSGGKISVLATMPDGSKKVAVGDINGLTEIRGINFDVQSVKLGRSNPNLLVVSGSKADQGVVLISQGGSKSSRIIELPDGKVLGFLLTPDDQLIFTTQFQRRPEAYAYELVGNMVNLQTDQAQRVEPVTKGQAPNYVNYTTPLQVSSNNPTRYSGYSQGTSFGYEKFSYTLPNGSYSSEHVDLGNFVVEGFAHVANQSYKEPWVFFNTYDSSGRMTAMIKDGNKRGFWLDPETFPELADLEPRMQVLGVDAMAIDGTKKDGLMGVIIARANNEILNETAYPRIVHIENLDRPEQQRLAPTAGLPVDRLNEFEVRSVDFLEMNSKRYIIAGIFSLTPANNGLYLLEITNGINTWPSWKKVEIVQSQGYTVYLPAVLNQSQ